MSDINEEKFFAIKGELCPLCDSKYFYKYDSNSREDIYICPVCHNSFRVNFTNRYIIHNRKEINSFYRLPV